MTGLMIQDAREAPQARRLPGTVLLSLAFVLVLASLLALSLPVVEDEFMFYRTIGCHAFPAMKGDFWNECSRHDLQLFGHWLPLRSYPYVGSFPAVLYFPVYALWPSYLSLRFLHLASLFALLAGVLRIFRPADFRAVLLFGASAPILLQIIVDTGPIGFQLPLLIWLPLLACAGTRWQQSVLVALLFFIAVWDKPFFLLFVPGMMLFTLYLANREGPLRAAFSRDRLTFLGLSAGIAGGLLFPLLFAHTRSGATWLSELSSMGKRFTLGQISAWWYHLTINVRFFTDMSQFAHRIAPVDSLLAENASLLILALSFLPLVSLAVRRGFRKADCWLAAACLANFWMLAWTRKVDSGHHLIFGWIYPLVLSAEAISRLTRQFPRTTSMLVLALSALHCVVLAEVERSDPYPVTEGGRLEINRCLRNPEIASSHFIVIVDLGMWYFQSLYGDRSQIASTRIPFNDHTSVSELNEYLRSTGRKPLFLRENHSRTAPTFLLQNYPMLGMHRFGSWEMFAEDIDEIERKCALPAGPDHAKTETSATIPPRE